MARKTTPVKPPSDRMVSTAGKAMATGKVTTKEARSLGARIQAEREAVTPDKPKPKSGRK